ncbi:APC family permease [Gordonia sp. (in: high G+C Gram-positive bacteria)]|uniref:APC family permease n=1 Tax=Gordonia sp. (in: high G+C Gram-positive bacteria) TaxID=84139 RepID=UPI001D7F87CE|nr:APC family permease [Gordonia sp. (in: high G+C Gram-positive bacteria)]MCB1293486.1 APC family permease [Gordonia sp. (in: high G+C Gram-positive bacteria)]HMS76657.1 APC family permease [Gordonia sp. (in: high G+C Gram-positive bacteria)]HQV18524.1 APC family permease [Gordonia sp. (in: high G+C Gram-positive bacteria)]
MSSVSKVSVAIKRLLLGQPFRSDKLNHTLLPKRIALPVFASDAMSSVAYAPQEIFLVLSVAGVSALTFTPWVAVAVAVVMVVVVASYRQNVHAYPSGGGDYEIANVNLGANAGLTVGSALLVDYVLTVAVSIASAAENIGSAFPFVHEHKVWFSVAAIAVLTAVNLRGIRESGAVLAIPTYAFIVGVGAMLIWGFVEIFVLDRDVTAETSEFGLKAEDSHLAGIAFVFLIARAFSSGCAALTGVEAISNGVPAFRKPKSRNAAATLMMLGAFSITLLLGIVVLAQEIGAKYVMDPANDLVGAPENYHQKSMIAQLSLAVFGEGSPAFYFVAAATALILILAANTAFNGFPLLASVLAQDRYLPRQMHTRGDRLAFSNGILFLAIAAMIFVISFGAEVTVLIQLYIVGVFVSFTLSQTGMVRHWTRLLRTETDPQSRKRMFQSRIVNSVGLVMTAIVLVVVLITKFTAGAWIAIVLMVAVFVLMKLIHSHYASVQEELDRDDESAVLPSRTHSIVLVSGLNLATRRAVRYARATRPDMLEAITVNVDDRSTRTLVSLWEASEIEIPLKVIASPYREITRPVLDYVRRVRRESPRDVVTVFIPEYVVGHWWEQTLHNQSALRLKTRLLYERGVMVTSVPWQLDSSDRRKNRDLTVYGPGDTRRGMDGTERR